MGKNQKLEKILVPVDGSKNSLRGLDFALRLSKLPNVSISCINVAQELSEFYVSKNKELQKQLTKKAENIVGNSKNFAKKKGIDIQTQILQGRNKGQTIINYAHNKKFDLIVMDGYLTRKTVNKVREVLESPERRENRRRKSHRGTA